MAEQPDRDHADGDRAEMKTDRAVAKVQLGLEEREDVALDVEEVSEEPQHEVAEPSDLAAPHPRCVRPLSGMLHQPAFGKALARAAERFDGAGRSR